jgi:hypothetical protein
MSRNIVFVFTLSQWQASAIPYLPTPFRPIPRISSDELSQLSNNQNFEVDYFKIVYYNTTYGVREILIPLVLDSFVPVPLTERNDSK